MTPDDLSRIERDLDIQLPDEYRRVMLAYPFGSSSFAQDCELPDDPDRVIETNRLLRREGFFGQPWSESRFSFGSDGSGNEYFLDLKRSPSPVFLADHEGSDVEVEASDFASWVQERAREYDAWERDDRLKEQRRMSRRWWQFWK
jgi:hypothetical protein